VANKKPDENEVVNDGDNNGDGNGDSNREPTNPPDGNGGDDIGGSAGGTIGGTESPSDAEPSGESIPTGVTFVPLDPVGSNRGDDSGTGGSSGGHRSTLADRVNRRRGRPRKYPLPGDSGDGTGSGNPNAEPEEDSTSDSAPIPRNVRQPKTSTTGGSPNKLVEVGLRVLFDLAFYAGLGDYWRLESGEAKDLTLAVMGVLETLPKKTRVKIFELINSWFPWIALAICAWGITGKRVAKYVDIQRQRKTAASTAGTHSDAGLHIVADRAGDEGHRDTASIVDPVKIDIGERYRGNR
jgi:hypothetical protein